MGPYCCITPHRGNLLPIKSSGGPSGSMRPDDRHCCLCGGPVKRCTHPVPPRPHKQVAAGGRARRQARGRQGRKGGRDGAKEWMCAGGGLLQKATGDVKCGGSQSPRAGVRGAEVREGECPGAGTTEG